jgi:hypothetical protein
MLSESLPRRPRGARPLIDEVRWQSGADHGPRPVWPRSLVLEDREHESKKPLRLILEGDSHELRALRVEVDLGRNGLVVAGVMSRQADGTWRVDATRPLIDKAERWSTTLQPTAWYDRQAELEDNLDRAVTLLEWAIEWFRDCPFDQRRYHPWFTQLAEWNPTIRETTRGRRTELTAELLADLEGKGLTDLEIATDLGLAEKTISNFRHRNGLKRTRQPDRRHR